MWCRVSRLLIDFDVQVLLVDTCQHLVTWDSTTLVDSIKNAAGMGKWLYQCWLFGRCKTWWTIINSFGLSLIHSSKPTNKSPSSEWLENNSKQHTAFDEIVMELHHAVQHLGCLDPANFSPETSICSAACHGCYNVPVSIFGINVKYFTLSKGFWLSASDCELQTRAIYQI